MTNVEQACKRLGDAIERKQRRRPAFQRHMWRECAGCDKHRQCKDTGFAWLCEACEKDN